MAYATLAEVREHADFESGDTGDNTRLTNLIPQAQAAIDVWTRTTFEIASDATRNFDAVKDVQGRILYLQGAHSFDLIADITTITNGDGVVVTSGQYVTHPQNQSPYYAIELKSSSGVSWSYDTDSIGAIAIVGKWGYSETVPNDVKLATILLVLHWYRLEDQSEVKDMPGDIKMLLSPYRKLT